VSIGAIVSVMEVSTSQRAEGAHCDHLVQIYSRSADLADAAATFFAAGFEAGEPAVAIASAAHWPLIAERLSRRGWEPDELEADRRLHIRDADVVLDAITDGAGPSVTKFRDVVGSLLHEVARRDVRRRVRAFGEMVDILVRRGERDEADVLEAYWNELAAIRNFTLLCGYRIDPLDPEQAPLLPQIYRSHSRVLALPDETRFASAVERALTEVLGETDARSVYARVALGDSAAPESQLALMWVSAHMPRTAEEVLARARSHYAAAA
jgi:hypothetical protein